MRGTRESWAKRVARWKRSGLTARKFAAREGVKAGTLTFWSWKIASDARRASRKPAPVKPIKFVEVAAPVAAPHARFEIDAGSWRVHVPSSFDAEALRRLLDVLEVRR